MVGGEGDGFFQGSGWSGLIVFPGAWPSQKPWVGAKKTDLLEGLPSPGMTCCLKCLSWPSKHLREPLRLSLPSLAQVWTLQAPIPHPQATWCGTCLPIGL